MSLPSLKGTSLIWLLESAPEHIVVTLSKNPGTILFEADDSRARSRELLVELSDTAILLGKEGLLMRTCFAVQTYTQYFIKKLTRQF